MSLQVWYFGYEGAHRLLSTFWLYILSLIDRSLPTDKFDGMRMLSKKICSACSDAMLAKLCLFSLYQWMISLGCCCGRMSEERAGVRLHICSSVRKIIGRLAARPARFEGDERLLQSSQLANYQNHDCRILTLDGITIVGRSGINLALCGDPCMACMLLKRTI